MTRLPSSYDSRSTVGLQFGNSILTRRDFSEVGRAWLVPLCVFLILRKKKKKKENFFILCLHLGVENQHQPYCLDDINKWWGGGLGQYCISLNPESRDRSLTLVSFIEE